MTVELRIGPDTGMRVQVDESTIPVIDNGKRKIRKGYMWCVHDVLGRSIFFHYDLGPRSTRTTMTFLKDFRGAS